MAAQEAALPGVGALGVLPDHLELECTVGRPERAAVHVQVELEAHSQQQPPLDDAGGHVRGSHRPHIEGVQPPPLLHDLIGQHGAVAQIAGAAEVVGHRVELHAGRVQHLQALGNDLGADPVAADNSNHVGHGPSEYEYSLTESER